VEYFYDHEMFLVVSLRMRTNSIISTSGTKYVAERVLSDMDLLQKNRNWAISQGFIRFLPVF